MKTLYFLRILTIVCGVTRENYFGYPLIFPSEEDDKSILRNVMDVLA